MNLDMFDDMNGILLRERENSLSGTQPVQSGSILRFPDNTPLAMAYVPFQQWGEVYNDEEALCRGTIFPDLDLPFGKGGSQQ